VKSGYFIPRRLWTDIRLARLSAESWYMAQRMYEAADSWGRFSADPDDVAAWSWLGPHRATKVLAALAELPLVHLYEVDGQEYAQIHRFDADAKADFLRKRGEPEHPAPPPDVFASARSSNKRKGSRAPKDAPGQTRADKGSKGQNEVPHYATQHDTAQTQHDTAPPTDAGDEGAGACLGCGKATEGDEPTCPACIELAASKSKPTVIPRGFDKTLPEMEPHAMVVDRWFLELAIGQSANCPYGIDHTDEGPLRALRTEYMPLLAGLLKRHHTPAQIADGMALQCDKAFGFGHKPSGVINSLVAKIRDVRDRKHRANREAEVIAYDDPLEATADYTKPWPQTSAERKFLDNHWEAEDVAWCDREDRERDHANMHEVMAEVRRRVQEAKDARAALRVQA